MGQARLCTDCWRLYELHTLLNATSSDGALRIDSVLSWLGEPTTDHAAPDTGSGRLRGLMGRRNR